MTLGELYQAAIRVGMETDPRGRDALEKQMQQLTQEYEALSEREKRLFDTERLTNPFGDTRLVLGDADTELKRVVLGISISGSELLLAAELGRRGKPVDAVIGHHTSNIAGGLGSRYDTAIPQVTMAAGVGVPESRAWKLVQDVVGRDEPSWDLTGLQIAEALEMPLMCIHSPADVCLHQLMAGQLATEKPETVGDVLNLVNDWPECQWLIEKARHAPHIDAGDARAPVGKVYMCLYGGWNPTPALFEELCKAGVSTFVVVASTAEFRELAGKYGASIVVIPHYPADNAGINIMLDRIMPDGDEFEIVECSNYVRYQRRAH